MCVVSTLVVVYTACVIIALFLAQLALVIDGETLALAMSTTECKAALLSLAGECEAVVCNRMSPLQKGKVSERQRLQCSAVKNRCRDTYTSVQ